VAIGACFGLVCAVERERKRGREEPERERRDIF
jgi:hypothetical protein